MHVYFLLIFLILGPLGTQGARVHLQGSLQLRQNDPTTWYPIDGVSNAPTARQGHSSVVYGDKIVIFGGCYLKEKCYNDLLAYDIKLVLLA